MSDIHAAGFHPFPQQQRGNEEAAQNKEEAHAILACENCPHPCIWMMRQDVTADDQGDRERPHPIES